MLDLKAIQFAHKIVYAPVSEQSTAIIQTLHSLISKKCSITIICTNNELIIIIFANTFVFMWKNFVEQKEKKSRFLG